MNSKSPHVSFMRQAIQLSRESLRTNAGGPFGAVIVKNGDAMLFGKIFGPLGDLVTTADQLRIGHVGQGPCVKIRNQSGADYSKIPCLHIYVLKKIKDQKSKCKITNENSKCE